MESSTFFSAALYAVFLIFVFHHHQAARGFRGANPLLETALHLSSTLGGIVGLVYIVYFGISASWLSALAILAIGTVAASFIAARAHPDNSLLMTLAGFFCWPMCAYAMFLFVPS